MNEIGVGDDVKMFGGGMVGLQFAAVMGNLGSLLNGVVNYNTWLPEPSMKYAGIKEFFEAYAKRAVEAKVDPLGYYLPPFGYAMGQMLEQAVNATKTLDQKGLAKYLRKNEHKTIVGPIAFCGGRRVEGKRDGAGAVPRRGRQGHRAVPEAGQAGDPVPRQIQDRRRSSVPSRPPASRLAACSGSGKRPRGT